MLEEMPLRPPPGHKCHYCRRRVATRWHGDFVPACQLCIVRCQLRATRACLKDDLARVPTLEAELQRLEHASDAQIRRAGDKAHVEFMQQVHRAAVEAFARVRVRRKGRRSWVMR